MPLEREQIGACTLYRGDCLEVLPMIEADVLLTDPPYGVHHASGRICAQTTAPWMRQVIAGDNSEEIRDAVLQGWWSDYAIFGHYGSTQPSRLQAVLIWDKGPASGMGDLSFPWKKSYEVIFIGGEKWHGSRDESVIKGHVMVTRASMGRRHPNEKPVSLIVYLLRKHPGPIILDPFMGSGTTGVACVQLGRAFIGVEIEPRYFDIACQRITAAYAQPDLFVPQPTPSRQQPLFAAGGV